MDNSSSCTLTLGNISKSFLQGKQISPVLHNVNLKITSGEIIALCGPSGSGKTTLLQIAGLLDNPTSGSISINSTNLSSADDHLRTSFRRDYLGFVYQFHHLLPEFSALENIALPLLIRGADKNYALQNARIILQEIGLADKENYRPAELSGGQQQRVAVGRAIAAKPAIILADEPTGNLDSANADNVFNLLLNYVKKYQLACLIVTHNLELARRTNRVVNIKDGVID